ncbi:uncharacterized protein [Typha angustifolia]|uniref:uncharacterized protein isoform X2 n=1 Tax=Typha angustifolia TaxID=59011 RepID=UPI003C2DE0C9
MSTIELKLSRPSRVYRPGEIIEGKIIANLSSSISYQKILVTASGTVNLQVRGGVTGVIDSLYSVVKPISIMKKSIEVVSSAGRLGPGVTEINFSFILTQESNSHETLYETFHGGNINIQYLIAADITRGYLHKSLSATLEFILESNKTSLVSAPNLPELVSFYITQDTQKHQMMPELLTVPIRSIDIQLLRSESVLSGERIITDTSVIQTTQIADGDVQRFMALPIYVILPRLLVCPTLLAGPFSIEFQVSLVISFQSELSKLYPGSDRRTPRPWLAIQTLPLIILRTQRGSSA